MVWEVSVSWQRQRFSDLVSTSQHSVLRSMPRRKGLERSEYLKIPLRTLLTEGRWLSVCNSRLLDYPTTLSGICMNLVSMIFATWR